MSPANPPQANPNYRVIAGDLLALIDEEVLGPGDRLPTYSVLCERYGVTRPTVRQAYGVLVELKKVVNMGRRGHYVYGVKNRYWTLSDRDGYVDPWKALEEAGDRHAEVGIELISPDVVVDGRSLGEWFRGHAAEEFLVRNIVRTLGTSPVMLSHAYMPLFLAEGTELRRPKDLGMTEVEFLVNRTGEDLTGVSDTVITRQATEREIDQLDLPEAASVAEVIRKYAFDVSSTILVVERLVVESDGAHFATYNQTGGS